MFLLLSVEHNADKAPHDEHDIRFLAEVDSGKTGDRDELKDHERYGEAGADSCKYFQLRSTVAVAIKRDQSGGAGEEITDGCAYRGHIDKPAESFAPEDRAGERDDDAEYYNILGCIVLIIDLAEPCGKITVTARGEYKSAGSEV